MDSSSSRHQPNRHPLPSSKHNSASSSSSIRSAIHRSEKDSDEGAVEEERVDSSSATTTRRSLADPRVIRSREKVAVNYGIKATVGCSSHTRTTFLIPSQTARDPIHVPSDSSPPPPPPIHPNNRLPQPPQHHPSRKRRLRALPPPSPLKTTPQPTEEQRADEGLPPASQTSSSSSSPPPEIKRAVCHRVGGIKIMMRAPTSFAPDHLMAGDDFAPLKPELKLHQKKEEPPLPFDDEPPPLPRFHNSPSPPATPPASSKLPPPKDAPPLTKRQKKDCRETEDRQPNHHALPQKSPQPRIPGSAPIIRSTKPNEVADTSFPDLFDVCVMGPLKWMRCVPNQQPAGLNRYWASLYVLMLIYCQNGQANSSQLCHHLKSLADQPEFPLPDPAIPSVHREIVLRLMLGAVCTFDLPALQLFHQPPIACLEPYYPLALGAAYEAQRMDFLKWFLTTTPPRCHLHPLAAMGAAISGNMPFLYEGCLFQPDACDFAFDRLSDEERDLFFRCFPPPLELDVDTRRFHLPSAAMAHQTPVARMWWWALALAGCASSHRDQSFVALLVDYPESLPELPEQLWNLILYSAAFSRAEHPLRYALFKGAGRLDMALPQLRGTDVCCPSDLTVEMTEYCAVMKDISSSLLNTFCGSSPNPQLPLSRLGLPMGEVERVYSEHVRQLRLTLRTAIFQHSVTCEFFRQQETAHQQEQAQLELQQKSLVGLSQQQHHPISQSSRLPPRLDEHLHHSP